MQTATPSGNRYILTLIDDHSRYSFVILLKKKNEVFQHIVDFVRFCENKYKQKPKKFRSDRGGEYTSTEMKAFLRREGIEWELTAPYTPQQNGVAERKNRSLVEMARCMLTDATLHNRFWGEAVLTASYLQNRLPSKAIKRTPFEHWHGTAPDLGHIRIFGCTAYAHVPDQKRRKLDMKAIKLVLTGYEEGSKAYRLVDVESNLVTISRDVTFNEGASHTLKCKCHIKKEILFPFTEINTDTEKENKCVIQVDLEHDEIAVEPLENNEREIPRRSTRVTKGQPPERLIQAMSVKCNSEPLLDPSNVQEALSGPHQAEWKTAMEDELQSHHDMNTWTLTELPKNKKPVGFKWVFKTKLDANGKIGRRKARLVAQGFSQVYGSDYDEVFAPVGKQATLRALLILAGHQKMKVKHFDIKTAFLNGNLTEEIYMKQPTVFSTPENEHLVCKLNRSIYGLKQSAKVWNDRLTAVLEEDGFHKGSADTCLFSKQVGSEWIYTLVYVDDLFVTSASDILIDKLFQLLSEEFEVSDLGVLKKCLGLEVERNGDSIFYLHQAGYINNILQRFGMESAKTAKTPMDTGYIKLESQAEEELADVNTYRQAIGSLLYVSTCTRPDVSVAISILSRKITNPTTRDWTAVKQIMRYLKGTIGHKLKLGEARDPDPTLYDYADADWAGDVKDRKSNSGFLFKWLGGLVSWASKKQANVALSSTEAEYVSLAEACREALWLKKLFVDLNQGSVPVKILEDNQSCLKMLCNDSNGAQRTKHIATRYHFIRNLKIEQNFVFQYCPTEDMLADILTKPIESTKTRKFVALLGLGE